MAEEILWEKCVVYSVSCNGSDFHMSVRAGEKRLRKHWMYPFLFKELSSKIAKKLEMLGFFLMKRDEKNLGLRCLLYLADVLHFVLRLIYRCRHIKNKADGDHREKKFRQVFRPLMIKI